jgi:hypothetical protein
MSNNSNSNGTFTDWLKQNFITLLVLISGLAMGYGVLNARVAAAETKISQYPSQDWFELKFKNIDDRFNTIESTLKLKADKTP